MAVVAPRAQAIERRHRVPDMIPVAQPAAFLDADRDAEFPAGLLPQNRQTVRARIAGPRTSFAENLCLDIAGEAIDGTAHFARTGQGKQSRLGLGAHFGQEGAKLAFGHRLVWDAVEYGAPVDAADVEREVA